MCGKLEANTHIFWINKDRDLKSMCPKRFKVTLSFATWMHSLYAHILIPTHRARKRKKERNGNITFSRLYRAKEREIDKHIDV